LEIALAVTAAVFAILVITRPSQLYPWLKGAARHCHHTALPGAGGAGRMRVLDRWRLAR
jgi:hypothetical protein